MNQSFTNYLKERPYLVTLGIAFLTIATILLTLFPADYLGKSSFWEYDKLGHAVIFGSWTFLLGLNEMIRKSGEPNLWVIFGIGILFGASIEFLQFLLPVNREADFYDLGFDILGCFVAVILLRYFLKSSYK